MTMAVGDEVSTLTSRLPAFPGRWARRRRLRRLVGLEPSPDTRSRFAAQLGALLDRRPRIFATYSWLIAALSVGATSGPVGGLAAGTYAATAVVLIASARRDRAERLATVTALDLVAAISAELRAGGEPESTVAATLPALRASGAYGPILADRIAAACRVADAVGARLADLLERLELDARGVSKARAAASAQVAGAQATAWLLAALPLAGVALGYGMGAHPLHVLLHTKVGAACAALALTFQVIGLIWSHKLAASIVEATR
jgi:tight adherence protein B